MYIIFINKRALTFLEIVISLAILSVILVSGTFMFQVALENVKRSNLELLATNFARGIMAEIMMRKFDEKDEPPWTPADQIGCTINGYCDDTDEIYGDRSTYDDVDDYINHWEQPAYGIDGVEFPGTGGIEFQIGSIGGHYVNADMSTSSVPTNYKLIKLGVKVEDQNEKYLIPTISLNEVKAADVD